MSWTDAYFRYKMFGEIAGTAIVVVSVALIIGASIYDVIKARKKND